MIKSQLILAARAFQRFPLTTKVAIARYFSIGDKFLNAKISKTILVVIFSNNTYDISIAPPFSFLKWYSNKNPSKTDESREFSVLISIKFLSPIEKYLAKATLLFLPCGKQ